MRFLSLNILFLISLAVFGQAPTVPAYDLTITNIKCQQLDIRWKSGNGGGRVVFVKENTKVDLPIDNEFYSFNATFGKGEPIGTTTSYCVYRGTGDSLTITGLSINSNYHIAVYEFNSYSGGKYEYLTSAFPTDDTTTKNINADGYLYDSRTNGQTSQCLYGNNFQFKNKSTSDVAPLTFTWYFGDGDSSNVKEPKHTYKNYGVYEVKLIAKAPGCYSAKTFTDTVQPHPVAGFDLDPAKPGNDSIQCWFGNRFYFRNKTTLASLGFGPSSVRYDWSSDSGLFSFGFRADRASPAPGVKTVKLVAISNHGCRDSFTNTYRVMPRVLDPSKVSVSPKSMKLLNNNFVFTNNSPLSTNHQWVLSKRDDSKFKDTLIGQSVNYSFPETGVFYIILESFDLSGCLDKFRDSVEVLSNAGFVKNFTGPWISIYPNPSETRIFQIHDLHGAVSLSVYSIIGNELLHLNAPLKNEEINLTRFGTGTYILSVSGNEGKQNYRVVVL